MTETPSTAPATQVAGRNPGPRPALRRRSEDDAVVSARPTTDSAKAPAAPGGHPDDPATAKAKTKGQNRAGVKSKDKGSRDPGPPAYLDRQDKKAKDTHKRKGKAKAGGPEPSPEGTGQRDDKALVVSLPKPVRKALTHAAGEHGTTPERLVALVISEWLDH